MGAYDGDSALVLRDYGRKVISVELAQANCRSYRNNMAKYVEGVDFELHCIGIIENDEVVQKTYHNFHSSETNLLRKGESTT